MGGPQQRLAGAVQRGLLTWRIGDESTFTSGVEQAAPSAPHGALEPSGRAASQCHPFRTFSPGNHVHSNCNTDLRNSEKYIRTEFCRNPFHGTRMTPDRPLFPARACGRPSRIRRGRVECGYLCADVEDLNQAISSCSGPVQPCPFINLWPQGETKNDNRREDCTHSLVENGSIFAEKMLSQCPVWM
jgi:hypothetical protein